MNRKLRMGMVGGGIGAFIGNVHRMAAQLDGKMELVAGAFSSDAKRSKQSGKELNIDPKRIYGSYQEMVEKESALPANERIDFVSVVTPNNSHFAISKAFLEGGFNVICDKPATFDLAEAKALRKIVKKTGKVFALTHNYTGYPMVKEARDRVAKGKLGKILKIVVEYPQGWLLTAIEQEDQKQAAWRMDPKRAGKSCCIGDIGTHAESLARYITGLKITELCADFTSFIPGRVLEDDGNMLVHYENGARGILFASQISGGDENNLNIRVYGTKGSLEWHQEDPNVLVLKTQGQPRQILKTGNDYLSKAAKDNTRIPAGHPEAFLEAFANIYMNAAKSIWAEVNGKKIPKVQDFPNIEDGVEGMAFIDTAVKSANSKSKWVKFIKA